ncbi:MAG: DUF4923 family protein [Bacteroidales bacterium]|nr:DUF4923 family protein [Bacteroidales bacterium]
MKKYILPALFFAAAATLSACVTATGSSTTSSSPSGDDIITKLASKLTSSSSSSSSSSSTSSLVSGLLSSLLGSSSTLSQDDLIGTWNYQKPSCSFESENLLSQAGGVVAANKIETEMSSALSKVGIKEGSCAFTFNKDNTYTATIGSKKISGNYTLNASENTITLTYLKGVASMTPKITKSGSTISLLFESDKLLNLVSTVSALSSSSSAKTLSSLVSNYDGMYIGLEMQK